MYVVPHNQTFGYRNTKTAFLITEYLNNRTPLYLDNQTTSLFGYRDTIVLTVQLWNNIDLTIVSGVRMHKVRWFT